MPHSAPPSSTHESDVGDSESDSVDSAEDLEALGAETGFKPATIWSVDPGSVRVSALYQESRSASWPRIWEKKMEKARRISRLSTGMEHTGDRDSPREAVRKLLPEMHDNCRWRERWEFRRLGTAPQSGSSVILRVKDRLPFFAGEPLSCLVDVRTPEGRVRAEEESELWWAWRNNADLVGPWEPRDDPSQPQDWNSSSDEDEPAPGPAPTSTDSEPLAAAPSDSAVTQRLGVPQSPRVASPLAATRSPPEPPAPGRAPTSPDSEPPAATVTPSEPPGSEPTRDRDGHALGKPTRPAPPAPTTVTPDSEPPAATPGPSELERSPDSDSEPADSEEWPEERFVVQWTAELWDLENWRRDQTEPEEPAAPAYEPYWLKDSKVPVRGGKIPVHWYFLPDTGKRIVPLHRDAVPEQPCCIKVGWEISFAAGKDSEPLIDFRDPPAHENMQYQLRMLVFFSWQEREGALLAHETRRGGQTWLHFRELRLGSGIPTAGAARVAIDAAMRDDFGFKKSDFATDSVQLAALQFLNNQFGPSVIIWTLIIAEGKPRIPPGERGLRELRGTDELRNPTHKSIADEALEMARRRRVVRPSPPSLTGWPQRL